jgi:O-antigen/teichoic acid export membrane protein
MSNAWTRYLPAFIRDKVEGRPVLLKVLGNTGWLFADNILRMGVGLLVSIWLTRYLGPEQFGLLSFAVAFVLLFSPLAQLGLDAVVVRNIIRDPSCRDETLGSAFVLKLIGGTAAAALTLTALILLRPGDSTTLLLVAIAVLGTLFQSLGVIDFWFQSQMQSRYSAVARSGSVLAAAGLKVALILWQAPLAAFAAAGVADIVLGSVGLIAAYRFCGRRLRDWRATRVMARELLRDSWLFMCSDLVMLISLRADKIMIGTIVGNRELGIYSVAALVAEALSVIPAIASVAIFPRIVASSSESDELFHDRLQRYYNLIALLAYGTAVPATILAWWLVPLLFGDAYTRAGGMLAGLSWAGFFYALMIARSYYLTAMNWARLHFITDFLGCVINVLLNICLIPRYGGWGAVIASIVAYGVTAYGSCFLFPPLRKTGIMMTRAILYPRIW